MLHSDHDHVGAASEVVITRSLIPRTGLSALQYYPRLQRLHDWVASHLHEDIRLSQAASIACLEDKYFSRFFRTKVGLTFTTYINALRVAKAVHMLLSRDHSVQEVVGAVGFRNYRNCERWFKRLLGVSPRGLKQYSLRSAPHPLEE